jgi:hypothetical protein
LLGDYMTSTTTDVIDGISGSTAIKAPVRVATTANITLSGEQTIDGIAVVDGDRVLVKDQTTTTENGIYDASASAWSRSADFDGNRDVKAGTLVNIRLGTVNIKTIWRCTSTDPIVIETSAITFEQFLGTLNQATTSLPGVLETATDAEAIAKASSLAALTPSNLAALGGSATFAGLLELATDAEAQAGTDTARPITPANLQAVTSTEARKGVVELATAAEVVTGTDADRAVTPAGLAAYAFHNLVIQTFATPGANTYTPTTGMKYCVVWSTGGGGGGGGADSDGNAGIIGVGAGGGAGGTCLEYFTAAQIGASQTVTIGTAGTAGSATNGTSGGAGGDTTFGALHTATGGAGGEGSGASTQANPETAGGAGGVPTGGTLNIIGGYGEDGVGSSIDGTTDSVIAQSGSGGASFWGGGGSTVARAQASLTTDMDVAGRDGQAYGSGGSGAVCLTSTTGAAGGAGKVGVCVVIEFV